MERITRGGNHHRREILSPETITEHDDLVHSASEPSRRFQRSGGADDGRDEEIEELLGQTEEDRRQRLAIESYGRAVLDGIETRQE